MKNRCISINFEKVKGSITCWIRVQIIKGKEIISHEDFIIPTQIGRNMIKTLNLKRNRNQGIEWYLLSENSIAE